jgi:hypothetical protein
MTARKSGFSSIDVTSLFHSPSAIIKQAAKGNVKAFEAIVNRVEGPPPRQRDTGSDNDGPMRVVVEHIGAESPTTE